MSPEFSGAFGRRCFGSWHMQTTLLLALVLIPTFGSDEIHFVMEETLVVSTK